MLKRKKGTAVHIAAHIVEHNMFMHFLFKVIVTSASNDNYKLAVSNGISYKISFFCIDKLADDTEKAITGVALSPILIISSICPCELNSIDRNNA